MENKLYREFGRPKRIFCDNKIELIKLINRYNGRTNCYKTVYGFKKAFNHSYRSIPNYDTAVIDRIFMDFDEPNSYEKMLRAHHKLLKEHIMHYVIFSGGGYHIYALTLIENIINKKPALKRCALKISEEQDMQVTGDLARISRIPFTFHMENRVWCTPLTEKEIMKGDKYIREMAKDLNLCPKKPEYFGNKKIKLSNYDYPAEMNEFVNSIETIELKMDFNLNDIEMEYLPPCIQIPMLKEIPGYEERKLYFMYIKSCGLKVNDAISLVKDTWCEKKKDHSFREERQPYKIWSETRAFPSKLTIQLNGCCYGCKDCMIEPEDL